MASGKTHEKLNILLLFFGISVSVFVLSLQLYFESIFIILGYFFGTYFFGPDLDLRSRPYRRWKKLRFIWKPYQTFKHRSVWTHGYVISDLIRYAYLITILYILLAAIEFLFFSLFNLDLKLIIQFETFITLHKKCVIAFVGGNILASTAHTLTDVVSSKAKRVIKR
ncbi:metal-binding protein [Bacillus cereus]|uniref:metal-binding protein n=1 Tax=Bacillus cereus TaxID=1396 RepID=UPI0015959181|nr:metal-binding protein [Bacillus cereus]